MSKNTPYVKQFDELGLLSNPIVAAYTHQWPNRSQRRSEQHSKPFIGNGRQLPLTVTRQEKYLRVEQTVILREYKGGPIVMRNGRPATKKVFHYKKLN